jgi:hypothetical protein
VPARPQPPRMAPTGFVWVPVSDNPDEWRVHRGGTCRYTIARHTSCGAASIAALNRGKTIPQSSGRSRRVPAWWAYCAAHLPEFGRWIESGQVWSWQLTPESGTDFFSPSIETR